MASKRATWHHPKRVTFHRAVIFGDEPADETASIRPSPSLPCVVKWTTSLEMNCRHDKPLLHSNSTSHLHFTEQRRQQPSPLEDAKKRYFSSEGRFSIIDEQSKDSGSSTESDEDSPLPKVPTVPQKVSTTPAFSQSLPHPHMASAASVSRFRIVPVESRYKRGRWECFDYYQKELPRNSKVSCPEPPRALANLHSTDRSVRSWTTELSPGPATAPLPANVDVKQGRMTPTEMLQTGLESTLNTAEIKKKENNKGWTVSREPPRVKGITWDGPPPTAPHMRRRFSSSSTATGHNGNSPSTVAIDSKIEQAMDLVKSHLMFAVREEVEGLRQKIGELEVHIQHLESENAILREHISPDMLQGGGGLHNPR